MTNFEKIKTMSIEEMTEFLRDIYTDIDYVKEELIFTCRLGNDYIEMRDQYRTLKHWLESEVE